MVDLSKDVMLMLYCSRSHILSSLHVRFQGIANREQCQNLFVILIWRSKDLNDSTLIVSAALQLFTIFNSIGGRYYFQV